MTETFRQDARNLLIALTAVGLTSTIALANLPGKFSNGEITPSLLGCIQQKGKSELCDALHTQEDPTQAGVHGSGVHQQIANELNQVRIESLRDDINFSVPVTTQPSWYGNINTHLGATKLQDNSYEVASDPIRAAETARLRHPGCDSQADNSSDDPFHPRVPEACLVPNSTPAGSENATWGKFAIELGPNIPFGYNPGGTDGHNPNQSHSLRDYVSQIAPGYEWNIYETRWHAFNKSFPTTGIGGPIREAGHEGLQDLKSSGEALESGFKFDPAELGREFLPGESIEIERFGTISSAAAPVLELFRRFMKSFLNSDFGIAATAGFTTSEVLHYFHCGIEVADANRMQVRFTTLVPYPGHWWSKILGQSFGFVVGLGPFIDVGPISEDWLLPKWEPITWTRYGVYSELYNVDRTGPGLPAVPATGSKKAIPAVSVAEALKQAYREGKPQNLSKMADIFDQTGTNLGVVRVESDRRMSSRTDKNDIDLVLWSRSRSHFSADTLRTTHGDDGAEAGLSTRLITSEFQDNDHGPRHTSSIDVAVRTKANPFGSTLLPLDQQTQSLRMTYRFNGGHATRDEMLEYLKAGQILAQSAITGNPRGVPGPDGRTPSMKAAQEALQQITAELARVQALPDDAHDRTSVYFYIDLDPTAFATLLGPERAAEYLDQWLQVYGAPFERPADWATMSALSRKEWIENWAKANRDQALLTHLDSAWSVIEAANDAQAASTSDRQGQARLFVKRLQNSKNLDLYPFAGMSQMAGNPAHLFLMTRIEITPEKHKPADKISFGAVGSDYEVPITMIAPGKAE